LCIQALRKDILQALVRMLQNVYYIYFNFLVLLGIFSWILQEEETGEYLFQLGKHQWVRVLDYGIYGGLICKINNVYTALENIARLGYNRLALQNILHIHQTNRNVLA
jgi:hypothetical protein